jgi:hypothetical protein
MDPHNNLVYGLVKTAPSPASTGLTLIIDKTDYGDLFPNPATVGAYNCTIWPINTSPRKTNATIIRITAKSDNAVLDETTLTFTRSQEDSNNRSILAGDQMMVAITAKSLTDIETAISLISYTSHIFVTVGFSSADYICDGVADEVQINQALTAVSSLGGGTVHLKPGIYHISSGVLIPNNIFLEGEGWATVIQASQWVHYMVKNSDSVGGNSQIMVRDLCVDGANFTGIGTSCISFHHVSYGTIQNCKCINAGLVEATDTGIGIEIASTSDHIRVLNNYCNGNKHYSITVNGSSEILVHNNYCIESEHWGIRLHNSPRSIVSDNYVYRSADASAVYGAAIASTSANVNIIGNVVNLGFTATGYGVVIGSEDYINITNNSITGGLVGIRLTEHSAHCIVNSNNISGCGEDGINTYSGAEYATIVGNTINSCGHNGINWNTTGVSIQGNTIYRCGYNGILLDEYADYTVCCNNQLIENSFGNVGVYDGIKVTSNCSYNTINNNICVDNQVTPTQKYGINIDNAGAVKNIVVGNNFKGNATGGLNDSGTSTDAGHNITT